MHRVWLAFTGKENWREAKLTPSFITNALLLEFHKSHLILATGILPLLAGYGGLASFPAMIFACIRQAIGQLAIRPCDFGN